MNRDMMYKGTRWFKCDLHVHTTASECFEEKTVTPEQWVEEAIKKGLDCIAVTDHNTGLNIDKIKEVAKGTNLTVFPGVEITCDTSKIHLLILFDVDKTSDDIRDFLAKAGISYGKQDLSTEKSIFDIVKLATEEGTLVIPAHIDEYNGLGSMSVENLRKLFKEYNINAVHVVHNKFLDINNLTPNNDDLKKYLNTYYNDPHPAIDDAIIKQWRTAVKYALEANCAILTCSDNPKEYKSSKHGLWGIGNQYTWIKMDEKPSLEGMRQSFLLPKHRVKNNFDSVSIPYKCPNLWIKSITISNTTTIGQDEKLIINFNPQLNTIIGGRGSGKSSILRFIRGVFNLTMDIEELKEILNDHNEFYKREDTRTEKGVLNENSIIEIEIVRNEVLHKVIASDIKSSSQQKIKIMKFNGESNTWEEILDDGYIDFLKFDHYSQKQTYEIAQKPNALRERIDKEIEDIEKLKFEREHIKKKFLERSASIRTIDEIISNKGKTETKIKDLESSIFKLQQSGISDLITAKEKFTKEEEILNNFKMEIKDKESKLNGLLENFLVQDIDYSFFEETHQEILRPIISSVVKSFNNIKVELDGIKENITKLKDNYDDLINSSEWKIDYKESLNSLEEKKLELEKEGIDDITNFEKFSLEKLNLETQIKDINNQAEIRREYIKERRNLQFEYLKISNDITSKRREFVKTNLKDDKVKIVIKPFRNKNDFELKLRKILQRENATFQSDIDVLSNLCFDGDVEQKINDFRDIFLKIRRNEDVKDIVSGHFVNLVKSLNDAQIDEIEILLPEDEIEVKYRANNDSDFKSLSTASAGQKTTAILTFILSYGTVPLILDQPEDDLDNRLVHDLIVDRLIKAKENRQLIVVTHNANIPVNGDAEYIISMGSEGKKLKVIKTGTVEQNEIKTEICEVMEGGEKAFKMRLERYRQIEF